MVTFWDASAIVPLFVTQPSSAAARTIARNQGRAALWWGAIVECWSAFARLRREGVIDRQEEGALRIRLETFRSRCYEIFPSEEIRSTSGRLLHLHPLRASDALHLSAALVASGYLGKRDFVSFDDRLREAAQLEGLTPLP